MMIPELLYLLCRDGMDSFCIPRFNMSINSVNKQIAPLHICVADLSNQSVRSQIHLPPNATYIHKPHPRGLYNRSLNINFGFKQMIKTEYFFICDIDLYLQPDLSEICLSKINSDKPVFVEGYQRYVRGKYVDDYQSMISRPSYRGYMGGIYLCNYSIFEEMHGFNEDMRGWGGEDDEFRHRMIMNEQVNYMFVDELHSVHMYHKHRELNNIQATKRNRNIAATTIHANQIVVNPNKWGEI